MAIDLKDPTTFDQWVEFFKLAIGGAVVDGRPVQVTVRNADAIAQLAVALVQKRALERS